MGINNHIMSNDDMLKIKNLTLAPYIQLSIELIDKPRKCLSNTFRHQFATLAILIDYGYTDPILLKASVIHDIIEDVAGFDQNRISCLEDGPSVLYLVKEVSKINGESKATFLTRIKTIGSNNAKILKSADRISNLCDLGFVSDIKFIERYVNETEKYILPIVSDINKYMLIEIIDLIASRREIVKVLKK